MKVFLDTNVLVSAFATRGLSADVLRVVLTEHDLVTSEDVLTELRRVLRKKLSVPAHTVGEILAMLGSNHVESCPSDFEPVGLRDHSDERILAAAIATVSDVLVTGDKDLLEVSKSMKGIRIVSPRGFWELIGTGKST